MSVLSEIRDLEQIRAALSSLDIKGTNETVTQAMTIIAVAEKLVQKRKPFDASSLLSHVCHVSLNADW